MANTTITTNGSSWINYTSLIDEDYHFNVTVNDTLNNKDSTGTRAFTVDTISPEVRLVNPSTNNTNTTDTGLDVNFTLIELNPNTCFYSNDTYSINRSFGCGTNLTNVTWSEGLHNITIFVNDSAGNLGRNTTSFRIDTLGPAISIVNPAVNNSNSSDTGLDINFTVSDSVGLAECWYSNDTYTVNKSTGGCGINITNITWSEGSHTIRIFVNDSLNNLNSTSINFTIDTIFPSINITNPAVNNSNNTDSGLDINFTVSDSVGLAECWYANDTFSVANKSTGGCGINITNITWSNALHNLTIYVNDSSGNLNFSSISFNISVAEKGEAEDGGGGGGGGGGGRSTAGGGGGSGAIIAPRETKLIINPKILEVSTIVNKTVIKEIEIFNKGNFDEKIKINIKSLEDIIDIGDLEFILDSGKKRKIKVRITPSETGVYVGKIIINGEEVLVSINVQSENLLVNVNLTIPKKFKAVNIGDKLKGNFQLTTTNLKQGTPVTISYIIRDYEGNKYITETETLFLENTENFEKEFNLEKLEPGNYLLSTELVYVNGFAVSSSNFEVKRILSKTLVLTSLVIGVLLLTLINIIILRHFRKLKKLRKFRKMKRYKR